MTTPRIPIGASPTRVVSIAGRYANRHGLIAGATGTGKTVTLMTLAEGFSAAGVPVFLADVKGDLATIERSTPAQKLDVFGQDGERLSIRVDSLGPELMARLLGVSDIQASTIDVAFELARSERRTLATLNEFRTVLRAMAGAHRAYSRRFGLISPASVAAIQRALLVLERDGAGELFGRTTFNVAWLLGCDMRDGRGIVSILSAARLMRSPMAYAAVLLFILGELYDRLPEVGELVQPRLVVFFDEAHLLFADIAPGLLQRIERTVRLIRSKGVGVYFASQSPSDIPPLILGQLGNRIQHALRAATIADQRAVRAAAETMPINPTINAFAAISTMGVGSALVSTIGDDGAPQPVELVKVDRPRCMTLDCIPPGLSAVVRPEPGQVAPAPRAKGTVLAFAFLAAVAIGIIQACRAILGL